MGSEEEEGSPNVKDAEGPIAVFPRTKTPVAVVLEPPLANRTDLVMDEQAAKEPGLPERRRRRHRRREEGAVTTCGAGTPRPNLSLDRVTAMIAEISLPLSPSNVLWAVPRSRLHVRHSPLASPPSYVAYSTVPPARVKQDRHL